MHLNLIGMPLFYGCDRPGVEKGPQSLRNSGIIRVLEENHNVTDIGDIFVENASNEEKYSYRNDMKYLKEIINCTTLLGNSVYNSLSENKFPLILGGDHALAIGSIAGCSKYFGNDLGIIWIDAHSDLNTNLTSPTGNIHGMPLAVSMGIGYEELTSVLFNDFKIKPQNIFILACRDLDAGEISLLEDMPVNVWSMNTIKEKGLDNVLEEVNNIISKNNIKNIHLSYDIDCLDPKYVPGTGTPVHSGLSFKESTKILKSIFSTSLVRSMDFVEYNPDLDINFQTNETCMEIIKVISENLKK